MFYVKIVYVCYVVNSYEKSYKVPQFAAYENAFFKNLTHFHDFINWFRIEEDKENELIKRECNFYLANPKLQVIRKATTIFFAKHLITNPPITNPPVN